MPDREISAKVGRKSADLESAGFLINYKKRISWKSCGRQSGKGAVKTCSLSMYNHIMQRLERPLS
jgi:hypothetical protein